MLDFVLFVSFCSTPWPRLSCYPPKKHPALVVFDCASEPGWTTWDKRVVFGFQSRRAGCDLRFASVIGSIYSPSSLVAVHEQGRVNSHSSLAKSTAVLLHHPCHLKRAAAICSSRDILTAHNICYSTVNHVTP